MAENYYRSLYAGAQIDAAVGRVVNGELDDVSAEAREAQQTARAAAEQAKKAFAYAQDVADGAAAVEELKAHLSDIDNPHHILPTQVGGIPVVVTYTPENGVNGVEYAVDVSGVTELSTGMLLIILPHTKSRSANQCVLSVNGGSAVDIKRPGRTTETELGNEKNAIGWIAAGFPLVLLYNGNCWLTVSLPKPMASDIYGAVSVSRGGTGVTSMPLGNLLIGNGTSAIDTLPPNEAAEYIDALSLYGGTMIGALTVQQPTEAGHAANKGYVDRLVGNVAALLDSINGEVV